MCGRLLFLYGGAFGENAIAPVAELLQPQDVPFTTYDGGRRSMPMYDVRSTMCDFQ